MFGLVLDDPLVASFDLVSSAAHHPPLDEIVRAPLLFRIWVMHRALRDWHLIGNVSPPPTERAQLWFAKHDTITGEWTLTDGAQERPSSGDESRRLEPAAVWSGNHVIDRLRDALAGRPNKWLEGMRRGSSSQGVSNEPNHRR